MRLRFAPSPTGQLHLGSIRTALFNYLLARQQAGIFVVRVEDTDRIRSTQEHEDEILAGLDWLGLIHDEGVFISGEQGEYGPYHQLARQAQHQKYLEKLLETGQAYECFCSQETLDAEREKAQKEKRAFVYPGGCRNLSDEQRAQLKAEGKKPAIRFQTPDRIVKFKDMIRGEIRTDTSLFGDFIIAKPSGAILFTLANAIDDAEMKISHVIRGEDHISNTPKQILLYEALGFTPPEFGHLPLILNENRSKMSKRDAEKLTCESLRTAGYLPEAILNYAALLGWNPGDEREIFTLAELVECFSIDRVNKSGAAFSQDKLDWVNASHIRRLPIERLWELVQPYLDKANIQTDTHDLDYCHRALATAVPRLGLLSQAPELLEFFFITPEYESSILLSEKMKVDTATAEKALEITIAFLEKCENFSEECLKDEMLKLVAEAEMKNGQVFWPARAALTGAERSPGVFEMISVLGRDESIARIRTALDKLSS